MQPFTTPWKHQKTVRYRIGALVTNWLTYWEKKRGIRHMNYKRVFHMVLLTGWQMNLKLIMHILLLLLNFHFFQEIVTLILGKSRRRSPSFTTTLFRQFISYAESSVFWCSLGHSSPHKKKLTPIFSKF